MILGLNRARLTALIGLLFALALLAWSVHDVAFGDVARHLSEARIGWFGAAFGVVLLTLPLRVIRWQYLLRMEGAALPFGALWHATSIGMLANNLLPARAGEFARAYAIRELANCRFSTAFASIVVERVFDGVTVVLLLVVAILAGGFDTDTRIGGASVQALAMLGGVCFGALLLAAAMVVRWPVPAVRLLGAAARRLGREPLARSLETMGEGLIQGLQALRTFRQIASVTLWSLAIWIVNAASFWIGFVAFDLDTSWNAALLLQSVLAVGIMLPSTPGFFGVFEAGSAAVTFAISYHIVLFGLSTSIGLWSLWRANLRWGRLRVAAAVPPG
jgi:glycosyltransferase 2 family protein